MKTFHKLTFFLTLFAGLMLSIQGGAQSAGAPAGDDDFDRLDGVGESGKRVDVIEWEGNLEIHVYPGGSLRGLALKLDKKNKNKPVMVIGYRFDNSPQKTIIRRNILSIDLREGFKAFKDPSVSEYDKIIISNNGLSGQVTAFKLDPEPTQLYPDGHPALQKDVAGQPGSSARGPASGDDSPAKTYERQQQQKREMEDTGSIKPFSF